MISSSFHKSSSFWRSDWFAGVLVVVVVAALHGGSDLFASLERRFYDVASMHTGRQPSGQIAVIAIDDLSMASMGRWPWPRDVHAQLIDQLTAAKAKTVVETVFFSEPQVDRGLAYIQKIKGLLAAPGLDPAQVPSATHAALATVVAEAETALDTDGHLARSLARANNVILSVSRATDEADGFSVFGSVAAGVGHLNLMPDVDGVLRTVPLWEHPQGEVAPSVALLAAAKSLDLTQADIKLKRGRFVQIGQLRVPTDALTRMRPQFYPARQGKPAFAPDSFYDVFTGKIPASKYAGKIVIIGVTAAGVGAQWAVPGSPALSVPETMAHMTSSILNAHAIVQPSWAIAATLGAMLLICSYMVLALPRLSAGGAALATVLLLAALLGTEFALLSGWALWIEMTLPAALLLIGYLALTAKRLLTTEAAPPKPDEESAETNRMMGLALQGQGQLDLAFERLRKVPMGDALMGNWYSLALGFERKGQFDKAESVYQLMAAYNPDYKDIKAKLNRGSDFSATVILGSTQAHQGEASMLGRYQVEKELGKGAMGVVYLGRDPNIGRLVAIKTLALGEEFEGTDLVDARERFFREAETAGRLQHQNIVTIFDAGEAHGLSYIAMEFLKGKDLVDACQQAHLLPVPVVLSIVARVAEALAYAHRQHVVHRDIKPANIMYEPHSDTLKVTDFGIARITDSSKTRTGLVLGTPSFMSPEQLSGKKVDGRSDLYSLGVMLFQMLTGALPFRGASMAELMFKITNHEAPDIRTLRQDLPPGLAALVAFSLNKKPEARYQDGDQFARDLREALTAANPLDVAL